MRKSDISYAKVICILSISIGERCINPHTTVYKHTKVYDVILLQREIPPTWRWQLS